MPGPPLESSSLDFASRNENDLIGPPGTGSRRRLTTAWRDHPAPPVHPSVTRCPQSSKRVRRRLLGHPPALRRQLFLVLPGVQMSTSSLSGSLSSWSTGLRPHRKRPQGHHDQRLPQRLPERDDHQEPDPRRAPLPRRNRDRDGAGRRTVRSFSPKPWDLGSAGFLADPGSWSAWWNQVIPTSKLSKWAVCRIEMPFGFEQAVCVVSGLVDPAELEQGADKEI